MSYVCVVTVGQDSRIGAGEWNQVSWPIYGGVQVLVM